jgi:hypothetical protein
MEKTPELGRIRGVGASVIGHRLVGEEGAKHRPDARSIDRHTGASSGILHAATELPSPSFQAFIYSRLAQEQ